MKHFLAQFAVLITVTLVGVGLGWLLDVHNLGWGAWGAMFGWALAEYDR